METGLNTRLKEELVLNTDFHIEYPENCPLMMNGKDIIYSCGKFHYSRLYGELSDNELNHVFLFSPYFSSNLKPDFDKQETWELKWLTIEELKDWMKERPYDFAAWFEPAFNLAYEVLCHQVRGIDLFWSFGGQGY